MPEVVGRPAHERRTPWRSAAGMAAPVLIAIAGVLAGCSAPPSRLEAYLRAVAGAEDDRGWHYLGEVARQTYGDDLTAYLRDAEAADWARFQWETPEAGWSDDDFTEVHADVPSGPASVPEFLIEHRILSGDCSEGEPDGILVFHHGGPLHDELNAGGLSGSQMRCNSNFIGDAAFED